MEATLAMSKLSKLYSQKDSSPSGIACTFFKINGQWGIKTYKSKVTRNKCYDTQKMIAEHGFAPKVGESFEFNVGAETLYCYVTEVAESLYPPNYYELRTKYMANKQTRKESDEYYTLQAEVWDKYRDQIIDTNDCMEVATGWKNLDKHCGNWGLLRGNLVCIDFGND